jgi:hypothetical protein
VFSRSFGLRLFLPLILFRRLRNIAISAVVSLMTSTSTFAGMTISSAQSPPRKSHASRVASGVDLQFPVMATAVRAALSSLATPRIADQQRPRASVGLP